jgi:hypothetical protein
MEWVIAVLAIVVLGPPWGYLMAKFVSAGWSAGKWRAYMSLANQKRREEG